MFSLVALGLLLTPAHATETQPGALLPGAVPVEAGSASVGTTVGGYAMIFTGTGIYAGIEGSWAPTEALQLTVDGATFTDRFTGALVSARYLVVNDDAFRLAPFASVGASNDGAGAGAGFALDTGFTGVRFDLSVPVFLLSTGDYPIAAPALLETGISFLAGEHDRIRIGTASALPNVSWKHIEKHWYVEGMVGTLLVWNAVHLDVGVRF